MKDPLVLLNKLTEWALPKRKPPHVGPHYADLYARTLAAAIDLWILFVILQVPFRVLTSKIYQGMDQEKLELLHDAPNGLAMLDILIEAHVIQFWLLNALVQIAMMGVIIVGTQAFFGTTPGKWLMGLRIVRYPSLEAPSRWRFVLRYLAYIPAAGAMMLGVIWVSFNKQRRGWHDYIAGTVVLNDRPVGWYWQQAKKLYRRARGLPPAENPVSQPAAEQGQKDGENTVG
ncbi:MAG: RDD family protein [Rickettsiales bacterium]